MSESFQIPRQPVVLVIMDGFGVNPSRTNNAVALANTPRLDAYFAAHPHTTLQASGQAVGLPDGQMGNSEVGHMTMGSGCRIRQDLVLIDDAIADHSFFENPVLRAVVDRAVQRERPVHLLGLVSDGGVHSHLNHLIALIKLCHRNRAVPVVHMITDGRDTPPRSAAEYLGALEHALHEAGGHIASVSGRYYAMDRDNRWERIEMAWQAMVQRKGREAESAREAIEVAYQRTEDDEFIAPTCIRDGAAIEQDDSVLFFNFRKDRPKQIVRSLFEKTFDEFDRGGFQSAEVTCLMEYDSAFGLPFAFEHEVPAVTLCQVLSEARLAHFHCAETEKYAHVTFFFNGGRSEPMPHEDRVLIPSPKVPTYDMQPEMSAPGVADAVIEALHSRKYPFIVVNFANGDMVGHTAVRESVIEAVEVLDEQVGRVMDTAVEQGYSVILTADHGNCDEMIDPVTGSPHTQHTLYPVPCLIVDKIPWRLSIGAGIDRIAPTVLALMGIPKPASMPADSLLLMPDGGEMVA